MVGVEVVALVEEKNFFAIRFHGLFVEELDGVLVLDLAVSERARDGEQLRGRIVSS